ncbi:DUF1501 domain-containing protein [Gimesia aquarii]|uniref:DUF1501 domain-containing protein n=1 Tax=Gimesia aquarii TaxID=2527964 RepID=A0A517W1J9_9PLAN|nr:DUF1501 domain-containing protein [Gimesia aquarii]QDT99130.1 hypothetical protein V144x_46400 [Gimesia aquarii]
MFDPISLSGKMNRRDLCKIAVGSTLSFALPGFDFKAAEKRGPERRKSVIILWMGGGPSQLETWDPHPGTKIGGPGKAIKTTMPGLQISDMYPLLAEQLESMSVIRSMVSKEGDHERGTKYFKTGYRPEPTTVYPALGAIITHQAPNPDLEIPQHISLGNTEFPARGGYLGGHLDAFRVRDPGKNIGNMRARVEPPRQNRRLKNLNIVSQAFQKGRTIQTQKTLHQSTIDRALTMMSSEQLNALEIDKEPESVRKAYGDSPFGRGCLVARRLVEQGVHSIEVNLRGWDSHANNYTGHQTQAAMLDPGFSSLLKDLKSRDLLDSTIVLCIGEFGRTPKINPLDGRDHWPTGFSCIVGGGGIKGNVIIGETDPTGKEKKPAEPVQIQDLYATILQKLNIDYTKELISPIGRPLALSDGNPIKKLI